MSISEEIKALERKEAEPTFTFTETADILGITLPSVSHAVSEDKIKTVNTGGKRDKIPASQVIQYGVKRGMEGEDLKEEIQNRTGATNHQITRWALLGLGLLWAYKELKGN